jgi:hypothetical protein
MIAVNNHVPIYLDRWCLLASTNHVYVLLYLRQRHAIALLRIERRILHRVTNHVVRNSDRSLNWGKKLTQFQDHKHSNQNEKNEQARKEDPEQVSQYACVAYRFHFDFLSA